MAIENTTAKQVKSANDIVELLNQAVDMQINNKLAKANFDKTDEGTILEVKDKENGVYLVQIQNSKFEAYSIGPTYYENDKVYIKIPGNDYTKQKFITGRVVSEDGSTAESLFNFRYPFDDFIPLMNLSDNDVQTVFLNLTEGQKQGYRANDPFCGVGSSSQYATPEEDPNLVWHWKRGDSDFIVGTTTLGLQMDVNSYLHNYNPVNGNYGLKIFVTGDLRKENDQVEKDITKEYFFNTNQMYGNPYNYIDTTTQQALIDLTEFLIVNEITAYFWQDYYFLDYNFASIPYHDKDGDLVSPNIILSNFKAMYGLTTDDIAAEKLFLYTYDDIKFGYNAASTTPRVKLDTRIMHFAWVHQVGDREFITINNTDALNKFNKQYEEDSNDRASVHWYRQRRAGDEQSQGVLYIAPGTSKKELQEKLNKLEKEKEESLASMDKSKYADDATYEAAYKRKEEYYTHKIEYIEEILNGSDSALKMRLTSLAGADYQYMPEYDDQFSLSMLLDINVYHERYKVVVCYDGSYEISDPIEFENVDATKADDFNDANKEIIFRLLKTETYKDALGQKQTRVVEDNSIGNFYVYDENNQCIVNEDNVFYSDVFYYIQIWIYNYAAEAYIPLTSEATEDTLQVSWRFPTSNTMISTVAKLDQSDSVYNSTLLPTGDSAFNGIMATTRKFKINDFWDVRAQDNIITAIVNRNGRQYVLQKQLRFGQSGSTGSKYTVRMDLVQPTGYMMVTGSPFQIETTIYDQTGKKAESSLFTFRYELLNDGPCRIGATFTSSTSKGSTWSVMNTNGYTGNSIYGFLQSDQPPLFKVYVDLKDPLYNYEIEGLRGFMASSDFSINDQYRIGVPDRVEYKSDGTLPVYDSSFFEVSHVLSDSLVYPQWFMVQYKKDDITGQFRQVEIPEHIKLEMVESSNRRINSNTENGTLKNNQEASADKSFRQYRLNPYRDASGDIDDAIAFFWDDDMENKYATFVGCYLDGARVYQAIAFAQNVYASSLVNSWDGQLLIDKENNAILTKMLAAGSKDSRNRFSGVMMGDWADKGDQSIDPIGLYGFNHGKQTYGFRSDGTGFIGAAGYGQIKFDGRRALISDYYRDHYINLNPMYYSINPDTKMLEINSGSYSQYFLYAKNKKLDMTSLLSIKVPDTDNTYVSYEKYGWINTAWADVFRNDEEHDYFVVDPNNGVYMSGGIIARYGMIGECLQLSSAGLTYQKKNGIIFIGQQRARDGSLYYTQNGERKYIEDATISEVPLDRDFWYSGDTKTYDDRANGVRTGTSYNFLTNRDKVGRYIFWAGTSAVDANGNPVPGMPANPYPNFGLEHDGTVHLNNAYIQGDIRARSLKIIAGDGQYHAIDESERMTVSYYTGINPALRQFTENGRCNKDYGDLMRIGDLWYDISSETPVADIGSYNVQRTTKKDANDHDVETGLSTSNPASNKAGDAGASDLAYKEQALTSSEKRGYRCYRWVGVPAGTSAANINVNNHVSTANGKTTYVGWEEKPDTAISTLSLLNTIQNTTKTALDKITSELATTIKQSYDSLRSGMSPINFYKDGNCYVSVSCEPTSVDGINGVASAPAGIAIYQLSGKTYTGSSFYLNGQRMGFYKRYDAGDGNMVEVPLLSYYNGNMALAGSLLLGMDISGNPTSTSQLDANKLGVYRNVFFGPEAKIILGATKNYDASNAGPNNTSDYDRLYEDSIVIDSGLTRSNKHPLIKIGKFGGEAEIFLAGFKITGKTSETVSVKVKDTKPETAVTSKQTLTIFTAETGSKQGKTETSEDGDTSDDDANVGSANKSSGTLDVSYKKWEISNNNTYKYVGKLDKFEIFRDYKTGSDLGLRLLVAQSRFQADTQEIAQQDNPPQGIATNDYIILTPSKEKISLLAGWDQIQGNHIVCDQLEAASVIAKTVYMHGSGTTAVELADKEWVGKKLKKVYKKLAALIAAAQQTGDESYGVGKNHTHSSQLNLTGWVKDL